MSIMFQELKRLVGLDTTPLWAHEALYETEFTPDMPLLEQHAWHLLFVCDETMNGRRENRLLGPEATQVCTPVFTLKKFHMWKHDLGKLSYPIPMEPKFHTPIPAPIRGELWRVRPSAFPNMDRHKQRGLHFIRKRVKLAIPYQERFYKQVKSPEGYMIPTDDCVAVVSKVVLQDAWMYLGAHEYWENALDNGYIFPEMQRIAPENPNLVGSWKGRHYYYFDDN